MLKDAVKKRNDYVMQYGGYDKIREADQAYNDLNRSIIGAMAAYEGMSFIGSFQYYGKKREKVIAGTEPVFTEYTGQEAQNFSCDFVIPMEDTELEQMIREYNQPGKAPNLPLLDRIMTRIYALNGVLLLWA